MSTQPSIGMQLYSAKEDCKKDLPGSLAAISKMGYQGIEFHDTYGYDVKKLRRYLDDAGLACCGFHVRPFDKLIGAKLEETIEFHHLLGNPNVIIPGPLPDAYLSDMGVLRKAVDLLSEAAQKLSQFGISVGYHNESSEFSPFDDGILWELFVGMLPTSIFIQLDTGNTAAAGANVLDCLERCTRRLTTVHLKPFSGKNPNALIGTDDLPWDKIINFCATKGRTEWFILEYERDLYKPMTAMEKSLENFHRLFPDRT